MNKKVILKLAKAITITALIGSSTTPVFASDSSNNTMQLPSVDEMYYNTEIPDSVLESSDYRITVQEVNAKTNKVLSEYTTLHGTDGKNRQYTYNYIHFPHAPSHLFVMSCSLAFIGIGMSIVRLVKTVIR